jgi:hypothetical protein
MPVESVFVISAVVLAFAVFGAALAYAESATRRRYGGTPAE